MSASLDAAANPELAILPRGRHSLSREQVRASQRARMLRAMVDAVAPDAWRRRAQVLDRFGAVVYELLAGDPAIARLPDPRFAVHALVGAISAMVTGLIAAGEHAAVPALKAPIMELLEGLPAR